MRGRQMVGTPVEGRRWSLSVVFRFFRCVLDGVSVVCHAHERVIDDLPKVTETYCDLYLEGPDRKADNTKV